MKTNLNWKKKWLDDKSGSWYSVKVPFIGWEYIVEDVSDEYWKAGLFLSKTDQEITKISNKDYKTEKAAKNACEKHLKDIVNKFNKWLNKNDVDLISDQELKNIVDKSRRSAKLSK